MRLYPKKEWIEFAIKVILPDKNPTMPLTIASSKLIGLEYLTAVSPFLRSISVSSLIFNTKFDHIVGSKVN